MTKTKAHISLVLITVIWGFSFIALSDAVAVLAPETLLLWRFLISAITLLLIKSLSGNKSKLPWKEGFVAAIMFTIAFFSQTKGMLFTSPSVAAFLTGLLVVFTPIFEGIFSRRSPKVKVWISSFLALFGTYLLVNGSAQAEAIGIILQITGAIFFALHVVYIGLKPELDSIGFVAAQSLFMAVFFGLLAAFNQTLVLPGKALSSVLYLGILASALGLTVQVKAQKMISASQASIIFALEPVFAAIFSAIFLHEAVTLRSLKGMILIFGATLIVDLNLKINCKTRSIEGGL
ncbi:MAG: DMT family transporter [Firmicutes bacterium]|nr:DMT family transporter [Bacillota bacterium]MDD4694362.1 DMT family transporter [Bacillota bacterium]